MGHVIFFILFGFYFLMPRAFADHTVTLQDYLTQLKQNDIAYEKILKDLDQLSFHKDLSLPSRQFLIEVQNEYGIVLGDGQTTKSFGVSAGKEIFETGTSISGSYQKNELIGRDEETLGIRIEQDLLKNAFGSNHRKQNQALNIENQILYLQVVQAYEDYVEAKILEYMDLQLAYLTYQASQDLYQQTQKLNGYIQEKRKNKIALNVDVDRIALQLLNNQEDMLQKQATFEQKLLTVDQVAGRQISPEAKIVLWTSPSIGDQDMNKLVSETRSIKILQLTEEALSTQALVKKRERYPELDLILGLNRDQFTRFNVSADRNEAIVGFGLSVPLGDSVNKAEQKKLAFDASVAALEKKVSQRDISLAIQILHHQIQKQQQIVEINKHKYDVAVRIMDQELIRYNRGQIELDQFLDVQTQMAQNQYSAIQAQIQLQSFFVQWHNLTDQLIQKPL
ncbi:MAG: TolC family protein [Deltaproteobacteria bacterium]|nr:TolC family protein [Deltaproteobacteria bacterium]